MQQLGTVGQCIDYYVPAVLHDFIDDQCFRTVMQLVKVVMNHLLTSECMIARMKFYEILHCELNCHAQEDADFKLSKSSFNLGRNI